MNRPVSFTATAFPEFACTLAVGFSQTLSWLTAGFESVVDDDRWERLIRGGAGIDLWADPGSRGWSESIGSRCTTSPENPDRALITISTNGFQADPAWWHTEIGAAVTTLRTKYPTVAQVLLQPVVGGPGHQTCSPNGLRASANHPVIDEAIALVAATIGQYYAPQPPTAVIDRPGDRHHRVAGRSRYP